MEKNETINFTRMFLNKNQMSNKIEVNFRVSLTRKVLFNISEKQYKIT